MLLVVSPAKNLDFESPLPTDKYSQPELLDHSKVLIGHCKKLTPVDISTLMGISDKLAGLNAARFGEWSMPFTVDNARPAVLAFNGDVYTGLDAKTFSDEDFEIKGASPYMLYVFKTKTKLPNISAVDGTARLQTVSKKDNINFYKLLHAFNTKYKIRVCYITSNCKENMMLFEIINF